MLSCRWPGHITEMDSFPLQLDSVPELADRMSFSTQQV